MYCSLRCQQAFWLLLVAFTETAHDSLCKLYLCYDVPVGGRIEQLLHNGFIVLEEPKSSLCTHEAMYRNLSAAAASLQQ